MALQLLPLLARMAGAAAGAGRSLGSGIGRGVAGMFTRSAGGFGARPLGQGLAELSLADVAKRIAGHLGPFQNQRITFDMSALSRRLGTPNPNQQQIDEERRRIAEHNREHSLGPTLMRAAGSHSVQVTAFTAGLGAATRGLTALAQASNNNAMEQLRMFNPQMAALAAERGRFDLQQAIARGREVSGTSGSLGRALMRSEREWQPYSNAIENFKNQFFEMIVDVGTQFEGLLEKIGLTNAIRAYNKSLEEKRREAQMPLQKFISDTLNGRRLQPMNGRPNERPGDRMP